MSRYCPVGDGEYDEWVKACPECGRPLVNKKPDDTQAGRPGHRIVWLATAPNEPEAQMWAETLRRQNIPVFLRPGGPGVGAWASVASFEHDLFVRSEHLAAARRLSRSLLADTAPARRVVPRRRSAPTSRNVRRSR